MFSDEKIKIKHVGVINIDLFKDINPRIITNEVVLTEKQAKHIDDRRQGILAMYERYIPEAIENPDYIFKDNRKDNTANIVKTIKTNEHDHLQIVLRLVVEGDNPEYKNSIITVWPLSDKKLNQWLRNKKIIYSKN